MAINIANREADRLTRMLAQLEGVRLTEAIVIAMTEALARRRSETYRCCLLPTNSG